MIYIKKFSEIVPADIPLVGGKNAALAFMLNQLNDALVHIPQGFALTVDAYWYFLQYNGLTSIIESLIKNLDFSSYEQVQANATIIAKSIKQSRFPIDLIDTISSAYEQLGLLYDQQELLVAVRSSATYEDSLTSSAAGQQETYLHVKGTSELLEKIIECFASLFSPSALYYRHEHGIDELTVALSICIQKMVHSDYAAAGIAFSLDPDSGFANSIIVSSNYGLGELVVQGQITPDEFCFFKPLLTTHYNSLIYKKIGQKKIKRIKGFEITIDDHDQRIFSLTNVQALTIARAVKVIEDLYERCYASPYPIDIEWAIDSLDQKVYIVQARPITTYTCAKKTSRVHYIKKDKQLVSIAQGVSIGKEIAYGTVRKINSINEISKISPHDILVTTMTTPDWVPIMKKIKGMITSNGGRTCHAAIVSREFGLPAIVGVTNAHEIFYDGQLVTLDCSEGRIGYIYDGHIEFEKKVNAITLNVSAPVPLMINIANPDSAFTHSFLPVAGVGLARLEFLIADKIGIHPLACLFPQKISCQKTVTAIKNKTAGYDSLINFYVDTLVQGIATMCAAFYPRPVVVRFSDFKTNEYANLLGGEFFEIKEENPMIGWRGASRYYDNEFKEAFKLECLAIAKVREDHGLTNLEIMVPFVRTVKELEKIIILMSEFGLTRGQNGLKINMMCELPSNILLLDQFAPLVDGFSIGSNDLTQLILGVDRDSAKLANLFSEDDPAVKKAIALAIKAAHECNVPIGICGQAPSDNLLFAQFLINNQIDYISLNPDQVLDFLTDYK